MSLKRCILTTSRKPRPSAVLYEGAGRGCGSRHAGLRHGPLGRETRGRPTRSPAVMRPVTLIHVPEAVKLNPTWPGTQMRGNSFIQKKSDARPRRARCRGVPPAGASRAYCRAARSRTSRHLTLANCHTPRAGHSVPLPRAPVRTGPPLRRLPPPHPGARGGMLLSAELPERNLAFDHNCYFSFG